MSFRNKYLKYKEKYLNLKNLIGGSSSSSSTNSSKLKYIIIPGSFSPFTNAHLQSIVSAVEHYLKLGYVNTNITVIIVPVPDTYNKPSTLLLQKDGSPPHPDYLSEFFRNRIIERGLESLRTVYPDITFKLSTVEQDYKHVLSNTGLVVKKMHELGLISPNKEDNDLFLGTDNVLKVPTWGEPQLMFDHSNLGIINRKGESESNAYATLTTNNRGASYQFNDGFSGAISVYYGPTKEISLDQLKNKRGEIVTNYMQAMPVIPLKIEFSSSLLRKYVRRQQLSDDERKELITAINQLNPSGTPILPETYTIDQLYANIRIFIPYLTPATYEELIREYEATATLRGEGGGGV